RRLEQGHLREALSLLASAAARPSNGFVPANAEAVLFTDMAELIACLTRDWLQGAMEHHWWWRMLTRDTSQYLATINAWREAPQFIPSALSRLAEWQLALRFVSHLQRREAKILLHTVMYHFGLSALSQSLEIGRQPPSAMLTRE